MKRALSFFLVAALGAFGVGCGDDDGGDAVCGNGVIETGEVCDLTEFGTDTCANHGYTGGTLSCSSTCQLELTTCTGLVDCPNGTVDSGEQCDGSDLDGGTCVGEGFSGGELACHPTTCQYDTTGCTGGGTCGNLLIESGEDCDGAIPTGTDCTTLGLGFVGGALSCTANCHFNTDACTNPSVMTPGTACTSNDDCNGGICMQELDPDGHVGPPGGYCYEPCDENDNCPLSGDQGICVPFQDGSAWCMGKCSLDPMADPQCRTGAACTDVGEEEFGACWFGQCVADTDCLVGGDCQTVEAEDYFGWCVTPAEDCSNPTADADFDGNPGCSDTECTGQSACPIGENCSNGSDDDGDGKIDCADAECGTLGICSGEVCTAPAADPVLTCGASLTGEINNQAGSTNVIENADCLDPTGADPVGFANEIGPEYAYKFEVTTPQLVTLTVNNFTGDHDIYVIREISGQCDSHRGCIAYGGNGADTAEVITFAAYPDVTYYIVVDGFQGNVATYDLSIACAATGYENCTNGTDDDADGKIDCADPECWGAAGCTAEANCNDGQDDDLDGAADCADDDCEGTEACSPGMGYWQLFAKATTDATVDLAGYSIHFSVDGADPQGYTWEATELANPTAYPFTPGTTTLTIADEANSLLQLGFSFPFQGQNFTAAYVTDDGYISFVNEKAQYPGPGGWNVYQAPRIAPLWADYDPTEGGTITVDTQADHVVITWDGVTLYSAGVTPNRFQLVLWANGDITMSWLQIDTLNNLPSHISGFVSMVGARIGQPPVQTNFIP